MYTNAKSDNDSTVISSSDTGNVDVLLLSPPQDLTSNLAHSGRVIQSAGNYPPLGLAYLAGTLTDNGYSVTIRDLTAQPLEPEVLKKYLESLSPQVVGVGAMTLDLDVLDSLFHLLRQVLEDTCLVLGGPCMEDHPKEVLQRFPQLDLAIRGEGEFTLLEVVQSVDSGRQLFNIPGTFFRQNDEVIAGPARLVVSDLDNIPIPAFELIDFSLYSPALAKESRFATLYSSRGCPFKCSYCHRQSWLTTVRNHSAERVVLELEYLYHMGVSEIKFYDETFTLNRKRVIEICRLICEKGLQIRWEIRTRPELFDSELAGELRKAGCYRVCLGVEGGSQERMARMGRSHSMEQVESAFAAAHEQKMSTLAFFMIGYPGDSLQDYKDVMRFARNLKPTWIVFAVTTAYANTTIYKQLQQSGELKRDVWHEFSRGTASYPHFSEVTFDGLDYPKSRLNAMQQNAYWRFYLHPLQLVKTLSDLHFSQIGKLMRMGLAFTMAFFSSMSKDSEKPVTLAQIHAKEGN